MRKLILLHHVSLDGLVVDGGAADGVRLDR